MKKMGMIGAFAAVILLAGCSVPVQNDVAEKATAQPTVEPSATPEATPSSEPTAGIIEMTDTPAIDPQTPWGEAGFETAEAWYIANMDSVWQGERPTDEALVGAGLLVCEQLLAGASEADIVVVTGDSADATLNNRNAVGYAATTLCP